MTAQAPQEMATKTTGGRQMLTGAVLLAATITTGLAAGVFGLYSHTIMPGLHRTDDRTFVGAFQELDRAIINPWFMASFFGALVLTGLAAALQLGQSDRRPLPWIAIAFVLYLITVIITMAVNVPLNDAIKAAGDPDRITDLAEVRRNFNEAKWTTWNYVRVALSTSAFGFLAVALLLHGRRR
jgi:uncharacterized membrane protein